MEMDELDHAMKKYDEADEELRRLLYRGLLISSGQQAEVFSKGDFTVTFPVPTRSRLPRLFAMLGRRRTTRTTGGDHITMWGIRANGSVIGKYEVSEKEVEL